MTRKKICVLWRWKCKEIGGDFRAQKRRFWNVKIGAKNDVSKIRVFSVKKFFCAKKMRQILIFFEVSYELSTQKGALEIYLTW